MGKTRLTEIAVDPFATLRDASTGSYCLVDFAIQLGAPLALGAASGLVGRCWRDPTGAIAGVSIFAALLCSVAILIFQLRVEVARGDDKRLGERDYALLDETFHNVLWAIVVGLTLALFLIVSVGWEKGDKRC